MISVALVLQFVLLAFAKAESTSAEQEGLATHNKFRKVHDVPLMTLDKQMCEEAEEYAKDLAQRGIFEHSDTDHGENLAYSCSSFGKQITMEEAVTNWYNEVCDPGYNFNKGDFSSATGHFTQVVWKKSTVLGMGQATGTKNGMQCTYIVARYKPAGNFMGKFKENVLKGGFNAAAYCASAHKPGH